MEKIIYALLSAILPTAPNVTPDTDDYIVYSSSVYDNVRALREYTDLIDQRFEFDIVCKSYEDVLDNFHAIRAALIALQLTTTGDYFIQQVVFDTSTPELWEENVSKYRKILSVTISYQEV